MVAVPIYLCPHLPCKNGGCPHLPRRINKNNVKMVAVPIYPSLRKHRDYIFHCFP